MLKTISLILSIFLLISPLSALAQQTDDKFKEKKTESAVERTYYHGMLDGRMSATDNYGSGGWFAGGVASGILLGLIGTAVIGGVSQINSPEPPTHEMLRIQSFNGEYQSGFISGFGKKARGKKLGSSVIGGLLGTAAFLIIYYN